MTGLESLNMKKIKKINKRKVVVDCMLMISIIMDFTLVALDPNGIRLTCEIFTGVFFGLVMCDAVVMVNSMRKRDFIL